MKHLFSRRFESGQSVTSGGGSSRSSHQSSKRRSPFSCLSLRHVRSTVTCFSTDSCCGEDSDVVVCHDEEGTEVMNKRDIPALMELAQHEYHMKRWKDASDCWNEALQMANDFDLKATILWNLLRMHLERRADEPSKTLEQLAKQTLDELRPYLNNWIPTEVSPIVLDYFIEQEEWEGAIKLANLIIVDKAVMARIYYERGIQKEVSTALRKELMLKCLECSPSQRLKLAAHAELVQIYSATGNHAEALKHHEARLEFLQDDMDIAKAFFEEGKLHVSLGDNEKALCSVEKGLELCPRSLTLLEAKADLHFLMGNTQDAIALHEQILERTFDLSERSRILYTLGRICDKSGLKEKAMEYYRKELEITQKNLSSDHLECSRIHHELARLADEDCDYEEALKHLHEAFRIEKLHYQHLEGVQKQELYALCKGTQNLIGKIHFKTGDFHQAIQASFSDLC
jgi:tetratricopeptide (TPR) repeat protein